MRENISKKEIAVVVILVICAIVGFVSVIMCDRISDTKKFESLFRVSAASSRPVQQKAVINRLLAAKKKYNALEAETESLEKEIERQNSSAAETVDDLTGKANIIRGLKEKADAAIKEKETLNESLCSMKKFAIDFGFGVEVSLVNPPCKEETGGGW